MGEVGKARRKRGGQPSNRNAVKHGFYAKGMTELELADLHRVRAEGLGDEIAMLRVYTRRVFDLAHGVEEPGLAISFLRAFGMAAVELAALLRTERMLFNGQSTAHEALLQALADLQKELKME